VDSRSVMLLVKDSDCSAYDCEFVALARQLGASFVTMDGKLLRAFPEIARALVAAR
jgi:predicted nucleic acid-binding protein